MKEEKILYKPNKLGSMLMMLYILCNTYYTIYILNRMPLNYSVGIFIFVNIVLSLVAFLASSKVKIYSVHWSVLSVVIGVFQLIRWVMDQRSIYGGIEVGFHIHVIMVISGVAAILAGIISFRLSRERAAVQRRRNERLQHKHASEVR